MGRTKKVVDAPTINSLLTLQIALSAEFAKRKLPQLTVTMMAGAIYLTGPCGQQLCKIIYVGSAKIATSDYLVIFEHTVRFIDSHLKTLKKLFELRQAVKAAREQNKNANYRVQYGTDNGKKYVYFDSKHPAYHKAILRTYEESFTLVGGLAVKDKDFQKLIADIEEKVAQQREFLKIEDTTVKMEAEANKIIADLSACSI